MRNIPDSKISYYGRNRRVFLSNPRYKSDSRVKTKPTLNQLIKETHNQFIEKWGTFMEVNDPALYESMTGKKAKKPVFEFSESKEEVKKIDTSYDDLDAYQKKRDAERQAELEKARAKQKKDFKFNFVKHRKDWSIYGGWVNAYEPVNKGRLASTQEWKIEKLGRKYY
jgi:tRNA(Ile)-lysidine synthase TilS/MesJ